MIHDILQREKVNTALGTAFVVTVAALTLWTLVAFVVGSIALGHWLGDLG